MDSVTQLVLGAAVGELVLGKKVGRKAALWGALFGTVPDLDVFADPLLTEIEQLAFHRGISHSLLFCVLAAPVGGWFAARLHRRAEADWRAWSWLAFWCLLTHVVLDCFTTYGTQILQPFSDYRVILGSIFIIDPLYTLPLMFGLLTALWFKRDARIRRLANGVGLALSSAYLLFTFANKLSIETVFADALAAQGHEYGRLFIYPTAFNNLLWIALAEDETGYWVGHYSLLDDGRRIRFKHFDAGRKLLSKLREGPIVERLRWFSGGLYALEERAGTLYFNDLHLPRTDNWLTMEGDFVFRFRLLMDPNHPGEVMAVRQERPPYRITSEAWSGLIARAWARAPSDGSQDGGSEKLRTAE